MTRVSRFCLVLLTWASLGIAHTLPELDYWLHAETSPARLAPQGFLARFEPAEIRSLFFFSSASPTQNTVTNSGAALLKNGSLYLSTDMIQIQLHLSSAQWAIQTPASTLVVAQVQPPRILVLDPVTASIISDTPALVASTSSATDYKQFYQCSTREYVLFTEAGLLRYLWLHGDQTLASAVQAAMYRSSSASGGTSGKLRNMLMGGLPDNVLRANTDSFYGTLLTSDASQPGSYHPHLYMMHIDQRTMKVDTISATFGPDITEASEFGDIAVGQLLSGRKSLRRRITGMWCSNHTVLIQTSDTLTRKDDVNWYHSATDQVLHQLASASPPAETTTVWYAATTDKMPLKSPIVTACLADNELDGTVTSLINPSVVFLLRDGRILLSGCDAHLDRMNAKEATLEEIRGNKELALLYRSACIGTAADARKIYRTWHLSSKTPLDPRSISCNKYGFTGFLQNSDRDRVVTWVYKAHHLLQSGGGGGSGENVTPRDLAVSAGNEYWFSNQRAMPVYHVAGVSRILGSSLHRARAIGASSPVQESTEYTQRMLDLINKRLNGLSLTPQEQDYLDGDVGPPLVDMDLPPDDANVTDVADIATGMVIGILIAIFILLIVVLMIWCIPRSEYETTSM